MRPDVRMRREATKTVRQYKADNKVDHTEHVNNDISHQKYSIFAIKTISQLFFLYFTKTLLQLGLL